MVNNKRWYLRLVVLVLLLALVLQVATMLHSQPAASSLTAQPPRMAVLSGSGGPSSGDASQPAVPEAPVAIAGDNGVIIGHSLKNDVSPPLRDHKPIPAQP